MSFAEGLVGGIRLGATVKGAKDKKASATPGKPAPTPAESLVDGAAPAGDEPSLLEQAGGWIKDKLKALAPESKPGEVSTMERLKAGNIDDPGSEAFKRWGAGSKGAGADAGVPLDFDPQATFTKEMWDQAPAAGAGANPAWDENQLA